MAGPSVMVSILADLSKFGQAFKDAGTAGASAAGKLHDTFSGVLGALNQTGVLGPFGAALDGVDKALETISQHAKDIGPAMIGVGGALVGIGAGLQAVGSKDQAAHQQLQASVEATGKDYDDYAKQVDEAIKHQENFGHSADDTQNALRILTQATGDPTKALQYLNTATDLAAAKHESLDTAATQLGKTYNGSSKLMKEFGATAEKSADNTSKVEAATKAATTADEAAAQAKQHLADLHTELAGKTTLTTAQTIQLRDAQQKVTDTSAKAADAHKKLADMQTVVIGKTQAAGDNMSILADKLKGQASAAADTFSGRMAALKAKVEDAAASFGQKYGPAITAAGAVMTGMGATIEVAKTGIGLLKDAQLVQKAATVASTIATQAATAAQWLFNAAMDANPIMLVVLAVAALVAGIILAYEKVTWFRDAVNDMGKAAVDAFNWLKDTAVDVFNWIRDNWPLLLAILTGPFGLAVLEIVKHWNDIKGAAIAAFNWLRDNWPLILAILTGPIGLAVLAIERNWQTIKDGAASAVQWLKDRWNDLVGFFTGLPGRLSGIFSGMWHGIEDAFRATLNGVIDLWNRLHFTLPHIDLGPLGSIGGGTIGVPAIPHLAAGGLMTGDGLIFAHAGEVITPAPAAPPKPAVHIENVNVSDGADVDLLIRKLTFAATAGRL